MKSIGISCRSSSAAETTPGEPASICWSTARSSARRRGKAAEHLAWYNWNVRDLAGKQATIEIVDAESGPWGHINIDQIELTDRARTALGGPLEEQPDFGTMSISVLTPPQTALASCSLPTGELPACLFAGSALASDGDGTAPFGSRLRGAVGQSFQLDPGASATIRFVVAWHFPNRAESGHYYASRFADADAVAQYVGTHIDRLADDTALWVRTYYDGTLPYWLLDRLHSTVSTLATSTCEIWKNGRFWAYEGVRCCHGTCGHVWNYEHALARLFPQLERTVREMQDFNPEVGLVADTGMIRFRGDWPDFWCGDAQTGYILKAYREHQTSADDAFLTRNWPQIRKALEFLFQQDANDDGVIEGEQHNTYDINFYGPNPMIGILYLGALRAGEELAKEMGDAALAERCHKIYEAGRRYCTEKLFNGEYYVQLVDLQQHPEVSICGWLPVRPALRPRLGSSGGFGLHPAAAGRPASAASRSGNTTGPPTLRRRTQEHPPQRWFAYPGEAGCSPARGRRASISVRNRSCIATRSGPASNTRWPGTWPGKECSPKRWPCVARCTNATTRPNTIRGTKSNAETTTRAGWPVGAYSPLWQDSSTTGRSSISVSRRGCIRRPFAVRTPRPKRGAVWINSASGDVQTNRIEVQWGELPVKTLALELPAGRQLRSCQVTAAATAADAHGRSERESRADRTGRTAPHRAR